MRSLATADAVAGIADGVDPASVPLVYPAAIGAVIKQHGFNLGWIGLTTVVGGVYVWRGSATAIFISDLVGGLADVGYFIFIDLDGHNRFVPGTVMTLISAAAIVLSGSSWPPLRPPAMGRLGRLRDFEAGKVVGGGLNPGAPGFSRTNNGSCIGSSSAWGTTSARTLACELSTPW
jgi:hypothetical protein